MSAHFYLGTKWSQISKYLKGRTDNSIKNRFNSTIKKNIKLRVYEYNQKALMTLQQLGELVENENDKDKALSETDPSEQNSSLQFEEKN